MISFVRHGETAHNRDGRLQGRVDLELSERGLDQAARLAGRFAGATITNVFSSPLRRARQTAAAIAEVCGCEVEVDDRLIELDYGDWDGRPLAEIRARRVGRRGSPIRTSRRRAARASWPSPRGSSRSAATGSRPTTVASSR